MLKYLILPFIFLISVNLITGFQLGAPVEVCQTMTPNHFNAKSQLMPSPYSVTVNGKNVTAHGRLKVSIEGTEIFRGFIVQARDMQDNIFGTFEPHPMATVIDCPPGKDNAITHKNNTEIFSAVFSWSPNGAIGQGFFVATIVKAKAIFWTHLKSSTFTIT